MIGSAIAQIAASYVAARGEPFKAHPIGEFLRKGAAEAVRDPLGVTYDEFCVKGSAGQGIWAAVPWIGVFDPLITTSATKGYYVVYLFATDMGAVFLSLNQGTTAVYEEFRPKTRALDLLRDRAALMRARLPEFRPRFSGVAIDLEDPGDLPRGYEAGHAFGRRYDPQNLPPEEDLVADLAAIMQLYVALTARGGLDAGVGEDAAGEEAELRSSATILEKRRYRLHKRVERANLDKVKRAHGFRCEVCELDFTERYGELGLKFIEAHHLTPLSALPEDRPVSMRALEDFAVLCANCHRMIHRMENSSDIEGLRRRLRPPRESISFR